MARSYSIQFTGANGNVGFPQLMIYMASAAGVRPKIFEFVIGSSAAPVDYSSRYQIARTITADPTGGAAPTIGALDGADPAALASAYDSCTGGTTLSTILYMVAVNQRATFRWVAAPGKEFVVPNTIHVGAGIQIAAQSTAYNTDLSLLWEE